jgi:site-specific recombinase XerD
MVDTRLRVSEAVNLKADDVHLAGGKWYLFVRDKGDKSRDVEVSEDLAQELLAMEVADFAFAQYVQENRSQVDKALCRESRGVQSKWVPTGCATPTPTTCG